MWIVYEFLYKFEIRQNLMNINLCNKRIYGSFGGGDDKINK